MSIKLFQKQFYLPILFITAILLIDQILKFYIKLNYSLTIYNHSAIVDWKFFKLLFVENKGMALGIQIKDIFPFISDKTGKLTLTIFRLIAIIFLSIWLYRSILQKRHKLFIYSLCCILAGAIGNIIDSVFYGVLFSSSYGKIATFLPENGGYAPLFFGYVVDMFQFPLFSWIWPEWIPIIGGKKFTFFEYIFNISDTAISTGILIWIFFQKKLFPKEK